MMKVEDFVQAFPGFDGLVVSPLASEVDYLLLVDHGTVALSAELVGLHFIPHEARQFEFVKVLIQVLADASEQNESVS